ncbi:Hypothetical predicted protein [Octopus vulgaris]|uniref:Uncharacterized protein n=1 Tax=Octopus vulgaris TaxID=6645 RepID=A0AA36BDW9_OCTVU|nr:Hypothetical predicted protein [Octopus vulgaris]
MCFKYFRSVDVTICDSPFHMCLACSVSDLRLEKTLPRSVLHHSALVTISFYSHYKGSLTKEIFPSIRPTLQDRLVFMQYLQGKYQSDNNV